MPIETAVFVVFDTELTGLNPRRNHIVSIGAVTVRNMKIVPHESFYSIIKPKGEVISTATFIHRLTPEKLLDAPSMEEVLPKFVEFCGTSILVGHQLQIDLPFLRKACRRVVGAMVPNPFIDTIRLARCCGKQIAKLGATQSVGDISYDLGSLARRLGLPLFPQHDALGDAIQTAYLLLRLISILKKEGFSSSLELCRIGSPTWLQSIGLKWRS
jgi:DNA polymerase-3 subunit epsilon